MHLVAPDGSKLAVVKPREVVQPPPRKPNLILFDSNGCSRGKRATLTQTSRDTVE